MAIGITLIIVAVLVLAIWWVIEIKRMKHKLFAFFLIALILFTYLGFSHVVKKNSIDIGTPSGMFDASKLYFSWLGSLFGNFKSITANAVRMDWSGGNETKS